MRPFFSYYGSKWSAARYYPPPVGDHVVEPFAGSAGYSVYYAPTRVDLIDADPVVVGVWDFLLRTTVREVLALPDMARVGDNVDDFALTQEAKWLIGFWLNRGSATPKKTRTAHGSRPGSSWGPRAKARIASQLPALKGWTVRLGSYADADAAPTSFIDPPYAREGKYYAKRFAEHEALGRWTQARRGRVIACGGSRCNWVPFRNLRRMKSMAGYAQERAWIRDLELPAHVEDGALWLEAA